MCVENKCFHIPLTGQFLVRCFCLTVFRVARFLTYFFSISSVFTYVKFYNFTYMQQLFFFLPSQSIFTSYTFYKSINFFSKVKVECYPEATDQAINIFLLLDQFYVRFIKSRVLHFGHLNR